MANADTNSLLADTLHQSTISAVAIMPTIPLQQKQNIQFTFGVLSHWQQNGSRVSYVYGWDSE